MPSARARGPAATAPSLAAASRVTLKDIAGVMGVSTMTVSRALRDQARISGALRERIKAKAREMGYRPDPALSALVHYRHSRASHPAQACLAWLNRQSDPKKLRKYREFDLYWQGATKAAEKLGFRLEEFVANETIKPARLAQVLQTRNVRGILLPPGPWPEVWLREFPWSQFCLVGLSRPESPFPIHIVTADQTMNTMLAVSKMRERGYRRIGFVGDFWIKRMFCAGYLWSQVMEMPARDRLPPLLIPNAESDENQRVFEKWIRAHRPDAILTENPNLPAMLERAGLRVPGNMGLAGLSILDCPISAGIYQNPEEVGRVGVLMLQSLINDNDLGLPAVNRQVLIEGAWVDGDSLPEAPPRPAR